VHEVRRWLDFVDISRRLSTIRSETASERIEDARGVRAKGLQRFDRGRSDRPNARGFRGTSSAGIRKADYT